MGMSGPQSETHEGAWHHEECGDLECDTATDGIRPDGATSQDRVGQQKQEIRKHFFILFG